MTATVDADEIADLIGPIDRPPLSKNRCVRIKTNGQQCGNAPARGTTVCHSHGAGNPAIQRKALVRATLQDWGINDQHVDPGETLLRLVAQSSRRVAFYGDLLRQAYEAADQDGPSDPFQLPRGVQALIGRKYSSTAEGEVYATEEAIRGLVALEANERKLCADFAGKAIAAGLAERQVRIAEQQGAAIIGAIMVALDRAGIVGPARLEAQNAAADYLTGISA